MNTNIQNRHYFLLRQACKCFIVTSYMAPVTSLCGHSSISNIWLTSTLLTLNNFYIHEEKEKKKSKNQRWWLWRCSVRDKKTTISSTTLKLTFLGAKHLVKKKTLFNIKRTKTTIVIIFFWYMKSSTYRNLLAHLLT